ncbi:MAG: helix-turn-helix domain-containing protein, partial [Priestia megaterium]
HEHFENKASSDAPSYPSAFHPSLPLKEQLLAFEAECIKQTLEQHSHNISKSAKILGLARQSLQYRMKRLNIRSK